MLRTISRVKSKNRPPLPDTAEALFLNEHYSKTKEMQQFLFANEIFQGLRLLIFASDFFLSLLFEASVICCDGTFKTVPSIFVQLYTINFFYQGKLMPAVYVLCKTKKAMLYQRVFALLHAEAARRNRSFSPKTIITDFESAVMLSLQIDFPESEHRGCFFHFCQV